MTRIATIITDLDIITDDVQLLSLNDIAPHVAL
jgi:hypothetical protein